MVDTYNNIKRNWKTTIIGLVLTVAGLYTGITAKASWTESLAIISIGIGFVVAKDGDITGKK